MRTSDLCNEVAPGCDTSSKFRTITGQCNNLEKAFLGAFGSKFSREIEVGPHNARTDITIVDKSKASISAIFNSNLKHLYDT